MSITDHGNAVRHILEGHGLSPDQIEILAQAVKDEVWASTYDYGDCGIHGDRAADAVRRTLGAPHARFSQTHETNDGTFERLAREDAQRRLRRGR